MKGLGITGMVLGLVSIVVVVFSCGCGAPFAAPLALVGLILSGVAIGKYKSAPDQSGKGMAVAGLVLCIIVLAINLLFIFGVVGGAGLTALGT